MPLNGATGAVLGRSLIGIRSLVDRSLADVRVSAGLPAPSEVIRLDEFVADARLSACLEAEARQCEFLVAGVEPHLAIRVDRDLLLSAVGNLLQNAFKYSREPRKASLKAYASGDRVLIEVSDSCGGLPAGAGERMFTPFKQLSADTSGLGLGLLITQRSVRANEGTLSVRSIDGCGCVFTISLPRHEWLAGPPKPDLDSKRLGT